MNCEIRPDRRLKARKWEREAIARQLERRGVSLAEQMRLRQIENQNAYRRRKAHPERVYMDFSATAPRGGGEKRQNSLETYRRPDVPETASGLLRGYCGHTAG